MKWIKRIDDIDGATIHTRHYSKLYIHKAISITPLLQRYYYYFHYTDEKTEVQRIEITCLELEQKII